MKLIIKKIILISLSAVLLMSIVTTLDFSSKKEKFKVCNTETGQIVFEDTDGTDKELALVLISDNENLEVIIITERGTPPKCDKLVSDNSYLLPGTELRVAPFWKRIDIIRTESIFNHKFISWSRGRGT